VPRKSLSKRTTSGGLVHVVRLLHPAVDSAVFIGAANPMPAVFRMSGAKRKSGGRRDTTRRRPQPSPAQRPAWLAFVQRKQRPGIRAKPVRTGGRRRACRDMKAGLGSISNARTWRPSCHSSS
jgi:hypothetical protein